MIEMVCLKHTTKPLLDLGHAAYFFPPEPPNVISLSGFMGGFRDRRRASETWKEGLDFPNNI